MAIATIQSFETRTTQDLYNQFYPKFEAEKNQFEEDLKSVECFKIPLQISSESLEEQSKTNSSDWKAYKMACLKLSESMKQLIATETNCKLLMNYFEPPVMSCLAEMEINSPALYKAISKDHEVAKIQFQNCQRLFQELKICRKKTGKLLPKATAVLSANSSSIKGIQFEKTQIPSIRESATNHISILETYEDEKKDSN